MQKNDLSGQFFFKATWPAEIIFLQLKLFFSSVTFAKPKSSRNSSIGEPFYLIVFKFSRYSNLYLLDNVVIFSLVSLFLSLIRISSWLWGLVLCCFFFFSPFKFHVACKQVILKVVLQDRGLKESDLIFSDIFASLNIIFRFDVF